MDAIGNLAASVMRAIDRDLRPIEHEEYAFHAAKGKPGVQRVKTGKMAQVRPREGQCSVRMFPQTWGSTALGFGGLGGNVMTSAYTVVVQGPLFDYAVYFGGRLAYQINKPNDKFFSDLMAQQMKSVSGAKAHYETPSENKL